MTFIEEDKQYKFSLIMEQLLDTAEGRNRLIFPFIADDNAVFSEEKTIKLINDILDESTTPIDDTLRELYTAYLYCAMRAMNTYYLIYSDDENEVINPAFDEDGGSFIELIAYSKPEEGVQFDDDPIHFTIDTSMGALYTLLSEKTLPSLCGFMSSNPVYVPEDNADYVPEDFDWEYTEEELKEMAREAAEKNKKEGKKIRGLFINADSYISHYETFHSLIQLYFDKKTFYPSIKQMISDYLLNRNQSVYGKDEAFTIACTYMRLAIQTIKDSQEVSKWEL